LPITLLLLFERLDVEIRGEVQEVSLFMIVFQISTCVSCFFWVEVRWVEQGGMEELFILELVILKRLVVLPNKNKSH
jgi:hypothetical protein